MPRRRGLYRSYSPERLGWREIKAIDREAKRAAKWLDRLSTLSPRTRAKIPEELRVTRWGGVVRGLPRYAIPRAEAKRLPGTFRRLLKSIGFRELKDGRLVVPYPLRAWVSERKLPLERVMQLAHIKAYGAVKLGELPAKEWETATRGEVRAVGPYAVDPAQLAADIKVIKAERAVLATDLRTPPELFEHLPDFSVWYSKLEGPIVQIRTWLDRLAEWLKLETEPTYKRKGRPTVSVRARFWDSYRGIEVERTIRHYGETLADWFERHEQTLGWLIPIEIIEWHVEYPGGPG